uniref:Uncharacterized protein n=1 Tax=Arundo donax TaxID=35708 RepID=A0A0A9CDR5_ARUDO
MRMPSSWNGIAYVQVKLDQVFYIDQA